jgi:hypothetical protein
VADSIQEMGQLNDYHEKLATLDPAGQASLLRNGFLPETAEGLMEAGIRCIPLIQSGTIPIADGAVDRLEAIQFKLKLLPEASNSRKVMEQFQAMIQEHKNEDQSNVKYGLALILGLSILVGGLIVLIVYMFTR